MHHRHPNLANLWRLSAGLAVLLVAVKCVLLPFPVTNPLEFVRWLLRLSIVSAPDLCFVAGLGIVFWAVLRVVPVTIGRVTMFAVYYLAGLYAIASIPMFRMMKIPLTVPLISFAGGPSTMASSLHEVIPIWQLTLTFAAPLLVVLSAKLVRWTGLTTKAAAIACLLIFVHGGVCRAYVRHEWTDPNRWERRIAKSPHTVLLASCVEELMKDRPLTFSVAFPDADESDFAAEEWQMCGSVRPKRSRAKNVVLIVLESTGVEYVGLYGSKYATTPNLDRLAAERGLVFDNVYVQTPNSCKSLVSLTASVYPRHDWRLIVRDCPDFNVPTIGQVLVDHGYRTCFLHSGYWGWKQRDQYLSKRGAQTLIDASNLTHAGVNSWGVSDRAMYQAALDWIDRDPEQPFFVLAYTIETHHPYVAPAVPHDFGVEDEELNRYLNAVREADRHIAWVVEELDHRGILDDTLIAVTSDHGESFGQHDQRVHSFGLYEPDVHVPLVLLHKSLEGKSRRAKELAQHVDIAPTLLDFVGLPVPADWQGHNLIRGLPRERAYFFSCGNEVVLGLREKNYKYHYYVDSNRQELFDLSQDVGELKNLAESQPERCDGFRRRVGGLVQYQRRFLAEHGAP